MRQITPSITAIKPSGVDEYCDQAISGFERQSGF
jgi:hypothetical protein